MKMHEPLGDGWLRTGTSFGAAIGLFDGLRAAAGAPAAQAVLAIALSVVFWGGAFAVAALLADGAARLAGVASAAPPESSRPGGRAIFVVRLLSAACLAGAIVSLAGGMAFSGVGHAKRLVLAAIAGLAAVLLARPILRRGAPRPGILPAAAVAAVLVGMIAGVRPGGDRADEIDMGAAGPVDAAGAQATGRPNILLVVMDTTRADHLPIYGYRHDTMPRLADFARHAIVYEQAIAPAPWTLPSHASLFTGQFPSVHRASFEHRFLRSEFVTAAELLRDAGYDTVGFSSNPNVSSAFNLHQGFDSFYEVFRLVGPWGAAPMTDGAAFRDLTPYRMAERLVASRGSVDKGARALNELVVRWLDERAGGGRSKPFFMFVNYLEPHLPYAAPASYRDRFHQRELAPVVRRLSGRDCWPEVWRQIGSGGTMSSEEYAQLASMYDSELAYLDDRLHDLLSDLERRGQLEETMVLITSDHGENLGEHAGLLNHSFSVHQTVLHVPLIVRPAGEARPGRRIAAPVSTLSVFASILEAGGVAPAAEWPPAAAALPVLPGAASPDFVVSEYEMPIRELGWLDEWSSDDLGRFAVRQTAIQSRDWKLVVRSDGDAALYDLVADPAERSPAAATASTQGRGLLQTLRNWRQDLKVPSFSSTRETAPLDEATRDALRSLGYI